MLSAYKAPQITKDNCILDQRSMTNLECIQTLTITKQGASMFGCEGHFDVFIHPPQNSMYSTSRKSLNKRLTSGHVLRLRPPTHQMQFALCSSAWVCVRLHASAYVCVSLHEIKTIVRPRPLNKHIQESSKVSQGYASSERYKFVGGVSETID